MSDTYFKQQYPTDTFKNGLMKATETLDTLGSSKISGERYEKVKLLLARFIQGSNLGLVEDAEKSLALNILLQEISRGNDITQLLVEKKLFRQVIDNILLVDELYLNLILKKLIELFYSRYYLFSNNKEIFAYFTNILSVLVNGYTGRNKMVITIKDRPILLTSNVADILGIFSKESLSDILKKLYINENYEISNYLFICYLINRVESWQANQNDESVKNILNEIQQHGKKSFNHYRSIAEEATRIMLKKCKPINQITGIWLDFVLTAIGDPRYIKNKDAWLRVGEEYYLWLRAYLSKDDFKVFLESMTTDINDNIYKYRKQFWLQMINEVQNTKIILGNQAYSQLARNNPDMYKRFNSNPESYGRLTSEIERSCIYVDFGNIHVIEGSHNAMLRLYSELPIDLSEISYEYQSFYNSQRARDALIEEISHLHSDSYSWQGKVFSILKKYLRYRLDFRKAILATDQHNADKIIDYLILRGFDVR